MSPTSTSKPLVNSKVALLFSSYRPCQPPCLLKVNFRLSSVSALRLSLLVVPYTTDTVNYHLKLYAGMQCYIIKSEGGMKKCQQ